jgi:hypothetical protein
MNDEPSAPIAPQTVQPMRGPNDGSEEGVNGP